MVCAAPASTRTERSQEAHKNSKLQQLYRDGVPAAQELIRVTENRLAGRQPNDAIV
jgi:hypothetical protein